MKMMRFLTRCLAIVDTVGTKRGGRYDESDRMKTFHSKMMLCDVLAEREAQVPRPRLPCPERRLLNCAPQSAAVKASFVYAFLHNLQARACIAWDFNRLAWSKKVSWVNYSQLNNSV